MAVSDDLLVFVRDALARGQSRTQIADVLQRAGWTPEQIRAALSAFAELDFPVPVPRVRPYLSAREAFMYLVLFATLYASAFSLGSLLFDLINLRLPDPADNASYFGGPAQTRESIRWAISSLVVAFPVFAYTSWLTSRAIALDPTKRASKIRRWLTYWTLFVSSCVVLGDITTLVYSLLSGEATLRFLLKVLVVALIAGTAFIYYLRDLRAEEVETRA